MLEWLRWQIEVLLSVKSHTYSIRQRSECIPVLHHDRSKSGIIRWKAYDIWNFCLSWWCQDSNWSGKVTEGLETLVKLNNAFADKDGRPLQVRSHSTLLIKQDALVLMRQAIRIRHTIILDDPFDDPSGFVAPAESPLPIVDVPKVPTVSCQLMYFLMC